MTTQALLEVEGLTTVVHSNGHAHPAVSDVSFSLQAGETLGIVGESGSGKSLTALSLVGLNPRPATQIVGGEVRLRGKDLVSASARDLRRVRGTEISMILQDPNTALNPVWTIGEQLAETLRMHKGLRGKALRDESVEALRLLKVADPEKRLSAYPHQLSGGMRQRVVAAIALACGPSVLIADEPTTALDVTVQAALIAHLRTIQKQTGIGILFITHDFGVVGMICDRVAVMYAGDIVEMGTTEEILRRPVHPYTQALVGSVPDVREAPSRLVGIQGSPPNVDSRPAGCAFHTRCWLYRRLGEPSACREEEPPMIDLAGRPGMCHFLGEAATRPLLAEAGSMR